MTARGERTWRWLSVPVLAAFVAAASTAFGAEPNAPPAGPVLEKQVRALFQASCYRCHSHQAGKSRGELMLDSMAAMRKGGATAPAVVPGHPEKSLLYRAVCQNDDNLKMPPSGKLNESQVALLREWIRAGAPWTEAPIKPGLRKPGTITDADRQYWAFQPVKAIAPPAVRDPAWAQSAIDRFIRHRFDVDGLTPSPAADRYALIRRASFDLTGLPPTASEVDAFVGDAAPGAFERLIDRLLASPHYGEQMARHWLDLVRYAESDGFRLDGYRPNAWRYRDYVIRAFNTDKPYDRFVREQLAGDEIDPDDPELCSATGFLCHGIYEYNQRDVRTQWDNMLSEITDVTADVVLGLGFACARCHDHKYDPILQKDYYQLKAFFAALLPAEDVPFVARSGRTAYETKMAAWRTKTAAVRGAIEAFEADERTRAENAMIAKFPPDIQAMIRKPIALRSPQERQLASLAYRQVQYDLDRLDARFKGDAKTKLLELRKELARFDADKPPPLPLTFATHDLGTQAPPIVIPKRQGTPVEPAVPTVLGDAPLPISPPAGLHSTGRRLALANWLTRADHPLTARVIVNRVWQQHFGRGLVATPNDFGSLGDRPSHPELLDWLADRFVKEGWSLKQLHRLIMISRTFQQSATTPPDEVALKTDPENRLLWRQRSRRLTAEQIRDAILAATGQLDLAIGGAGVDAQTPRRSVYTKVLRNTRDPLLDAFDAPEGFTSVAQRNVTTTPVQALLLLNSPFMQAQAQAIAHRLRTDAPADTAARVDAAFRLVLGRPATEAQKAVAQAFLIEQAQRIAPAAERSDAALVDFCLVLLNANEFLYVD